MANCSIKLGGREEKAYLYAGHAAQFSISVGGEHIFLLSAFNAFPMTGGGNVVSFPSGGEGGGVRGGCHGHGKDSTIGSFFPQRASV